MTEKQSALFNGLSASILFFISVAIFTGRIELTTIHGGALALSASFAFAYIGILERKRGR